MKWFNRNKEKEIEAEKTDLDIIVPTHTCIFKDMPWYMEIEYSGTNRTASYKIIEPFICINGCGKRINKILEQESWSGIDPETREKYYKNIAKKYKEYLKPRAVVEDMINNILMVKDPEHLAMVEKMRGLPHSGCGTSSKMSTESDFKIKLEERRK